MFSATPYQAPSFNYWLGTDGLGEPVAARLLDATGHTVFAVTLAVCIAALIGSVIGTVLAFSGRNRLKALCETLLSFTFAAPMLLLVLLLLVIYGDELWIFPSIGLFAWGASLS